MEAWIDQEAIRIALTAMLVAWLGVGTAAAGWLALRFANRRAQEIRRRKWTE
jgi:hypothetical protein